ncbi:Alpha-ketoglutarate-dependent dioxygenase alkB -like protein 4 [Halotydeus destructor]|nr:Alpha-ketoglutarate-dependent dioxygenase alkB -like protein 4 [Halotydeus destructor]
MNLSEEFCACKGIRTCLICEDSKLNYDSEKNESKQSDQLVYSYCMACQNKAWLDVNHQTHSAAADQSQFISIEGVFLVDNCITVKQETSLIEQIDRKEWVCSQSGRRKQDFGPKANFKRKKCKLGEFAGLPLYIKDILFDIKEKYAEALSDFLPVELCNLDYEPSRGSAIDPHKDDDWLWGNRLVTLNYGSPTILTLTKQHVPGIEIAIDMRPRSLLVLSDEARYDWLHSVQRKHITGRRVATTLRELTPQFLPGGEEYEAIGKTILDVAAKFV